MPITRTNTKRYVAICEVADCGWTDGPHRHRVVVSERLRYHIKTQHGLHYADPNGRDITPMKVQKQTDLPEQETGPRAQDYVGQLLVIEHGWRKVTGREARSQYGDREYIEANVYVYNTDSKVWDNPGHLRFYWKVVITRLEAEGPDDDIGGVLTQGTDRNAKEWDLTPPSAAQIKLLDKFEPGAPF
jgi:hypothetical protein